MKLRRKYYSYLKPLFSAGSPLLTLYLVAPLILLSINRNGQLNPAYLNIILATIKELIPIPIKSDNENFNQVRYYFLLAHELQRGGLK